ncbi:MAG: hypothetical protein DRG78_05740 [Epsilonproteobacteria bacterium]|nr:MAG: hypothetical protein DRG78_05740 [Campylobacterota bacterium]
MSKLIYLVDGIICRTTISAIFESQGVSNIESKILMLPTNGYQFNYESNKAHASKYDMQNCDEKSNYVFNKDSSEKLNEIINRIDDDTKYSNIDILEIALLYFKQQYTTEFNLKTSDNKYKTLLLSQCWDKYLDNNKILSDLCNNNCNIIICYK